MKTRIIHTRFWNDSFVSELSQKEKLLFMYLLTNEKVNLIGIYELPDKYIMNDLDLTQEELSNIKKKLQDSGKFHFDNGWIVIINVSKYNNYISSPKVRMAYNRELSEVPEGFRKFALTIESNSYKDKIEPKNTSIDTSIYTPINHKSKNINHKTEIIKKKKKLYNDKFTLEEIGDKVVKAFNIYLGTRFKDSKAFLGGLEKWLETYSTEDIETAIMNIKHHKFWKDKMTPVILFRRRNPQGESVDYISQLLNYSKEE